MMLAIVLAFPPQAFAWDDLGHRTICEIAFREVRDETRQRIKKLIRGDREFARFADACTWPDHPRRRPTEHYVNLPRDSTGIGSDPCSLADKCIVTAIAEDLQGLASVVVSDAEKLAKYLGHWVGDVHQPLHVSFADDCGGNEINTVGACIGSLHRAWDGGLIESALGRDVSSVAEILRNEVTPAQRADWTTSSPVDWANESFTIATSSPVAYCVRAG